MLLSCMVTMRLKKAQWSTVVDINYRALHCKGTLSKSPTHIIAQCHKCSFKFIGTLLGFWKALKRGRNPNKSKSTENNNTALLRAYRHVTRWSRYFPGSGLVCFKKAMLFYYLQQTPIESWGFQSCTNASYRSAWIVCCT